MKRLIIISLSVFLSLNMLYKDSIITVESDDSFMTRNEYVKVDFCKTQESDVEPVLFQMFREDIVEVTYECVNYTGRYSIGIIFDEGYDQIRMKEDLDRHLTAINDFIIEYYNESFVVSDKDFYLSSAVLYLSQTDLQKIIDMQEHKTYIENIIVLQVKEKHKNEAETNEWVYGNRSFDSCYHHNVYDNNGNLHIYHYNGLNSPATDTECFPTISAPHQGDGNERLESGNKWMPTYTAAQFITGISTGKNRTKLLFKYSSYTNLSNLKKDNNETLEMEIVFYNYRNIFPDEDRGTTYQKHSGKSYSTNIPSYYPDTYLFDNTAEMSFCVGCHDANQLVYGTMYFWIIDSEAGTQDFHYNHDGRFRVIAQRGYHTSSYVSAYNVFSEEHEGDVRLGISNNNYWVPSSQNAWYLASNNITWVYNDGDVYSH